MLVRRAVTILKEDGPKKLLEEAIYKIMRDSGVLDKAAILALLRDGRSYNDALWLINNARDRHDSLVGPKRNTLYPGIDVRATHYNRYVFARSESLPRKSTPSVLDVACGTGYGYSIFNKANQTINYISGDISSRALQYARKYHTGASYTQVSAEELPYQMNEFDIIVGFETLEHLSSPTKYLEEIKRISKPTAEIFLSVPYNQDLDIRSESDVKSYPHLHKFKMGGFKETLEEHFNAESITYYRQTYPEQIEPIENTTHPPSGISQIKISDEFPQDTMTLLAHIDRS
ncbi:bifunctional 2-polyprenyl-6-hydroxyphenol methylase/3-demethylubiquinol 3-O-methyltransferase UbiG [Halorubrum halophilum]|uniref:class I SAM-dependent methyltransferase n=1 Tax=Halorubrum halophilum TaxID=413816 RepID=UPI00186AD714|nr:class I SAM-dependent methyltransferase [Halorubrum halophilum]